MVNGYLISAVMKDSQDRQAGEDTDDDDFAHAFVASLAAEWRNIFDRDRFSNGRWFLAERFRDPIPHRADPVAQAIRFTGLLSAEPQQDTEQESFQSISTSFGQ